MIILPCGSERYGLRGLRQVILPRRETLHTGANFFGQFDYCSGEAGKISDLMTTGTAPEEGINAPTSM